MVMSSRVLTISYAFSAACQTGGFTRFSRSICGSSRKLRGGYCDTRHSIHLRREPILADADVHQEGHGQLGGVLHLVGDDRREAIELRSRGLENELVVHLKQH